MDEDRLTEFYKGFNLVPYAGNSRYSAHAFLTLLSDLYELSPSQEACIDDISFWAFEGEVDVVTRPWNGVRVESVDPITGATADTFIEWLELLGLKIPFLIDLVQELFLSFKKTGNAYLRYSEVLAGGVPTIFLEAIDPLKFMYLKTEKDDAKVGVISDDFFTGWFTEDPTLVSVFPMFRKTRFGRETVIHIKNKRDHSKWYGRPDSLASLYAQFAEHQLLSTEAKVASTEMVAKLLLVMQSAPPGSRLPGYNSADENMDAVVSQLRRKMTNKGNFSESENISVFKYPHGVEPPEVHKVDVNRDSKHFEAASDILSSYIFSSHRWSKILNGFRVAPSGVGGNVLLDEFKVKNAGLIAPLQRRWERNILKVIIDLASDFSGKPEMSNYGIQFEDKIGSLVDKLKTQTPVNENVAEQGGSSKVERDPLK